MTSELRGLGAGTQRTRRNLMKMGAILVPATLGMVRSATAGPIICKIPILNLLPPCDPPKGGQATRGGGANCFLTGTKILTARGERTIEDLAADNVWRIALHPMDRTLSNQAE